MLERYAVGDESFCYDYIFFGRHDLHDLSDPYASLYNSIQIRPLANCADLLEGEYVGAQWLRRRWGAVDHNTHVEAVVV